MFKAYQPSLDRYVALKVLPAHLIEHPGFSERFRREARAVAKLEHPHILPVHDYGQEGDLTYIAMRFVEGGTLKDLLGEPLALPLIVELVGQIAQALDYAHEHGVIHRDVKPSNVLMDEGNWTLLTDFGVARIVEATQELTGPGVGVGTPTYMSPEQGQGKQVDRRSDVYSLGVMLYEMVTGVVPFEAETPLAIVWKHVNEPLPLPSSIVRGIPEAVELVVLKAMAKNQDDRFQSAGELASTLYSSWKEDDAGSQADVKSASGPSPIVEGRAPGRRNSIRVFLVAGMTAIVLLVGYVAMQSRIGGSAIGADVLELLPGSTRTLPTDRSQMDQDAVATARPATSTQPQLPPTPIGSEPDLEVASMTVIDDFENSSYDGEYNPGLWNLEGGCGPSQGEGFLRFPYTASNGDRVCRFYAEVDRYAVPAEDLKPIQADFMVEWTGSYIVDHALTFTAVGPPYIGGWSALCGLTTTSEGLYANFFLDNSPGTRDIGRSIVTDGEWHRLRLSLDVRRMEFTCLADNEVVGRVVPPNAGGLMESHFRRGITIWADPGTSGDLYVDNFGEVQPENQ